jgi:hypothetical protein
MFRRAAKKDPFKEVAVEMAGGHAETEMAVGRSGERSVATWTDATERKDARRLLAKKNVEARATTSSAGVGTSTAGGATQLTQRAVALASGSTKTTADIRETGRSVSEVAGGSSEIGRSVNEAAAELAELAATKQVLVGMEY